MKNRNIHLIKGISLSFCILSGIMFPLLFNFLDINNFSLDTIENSDDVFISSINGKGYLAKYISAEDIEVMKQDLQSSQTQTDSRSHPIIDGHGTGYSAPSIEYLDSLVGKITLLDVIPESDQRYQATADISSEIYFPAVGDQGGQGSCSAWANAYYAYGYLEAKDYGWDASSGNPDYLLSPAWAYNIVSAYDYGSVPYEVAQVLLDWGVPTLSAMPYDDSDVNSWGDETAWRQAPYHRPLDYTLITYTGTPTIDLMKALLDGGTPVTIGIDAYQFANGLDQGTMDFILSSDEYDSSSLNHAQCLVGYDDAVSEGSDIGAFRVVNSWGDTWMDNGYYWLTYDAFAEFAGLGGQVIMYITDRIDYNPDLIATWEFSSSPTRMNDIVTLGVGPHNSPFNTIVPLYDSDTVNLFPDFMALDISEFYPNYTIDNDVFFFLDIGASDITGTISSFKLERYSGGILQETSKESPDVPRATPGYVNATFKTFLHELRVTLEVPTDPVIYNAYQIKATVYNNGLSDETSVPFEILLNDLIVSSTSIPSLPSGSNYNLSYSWTPTLYDVYNFTARTPPIPGETYISNNHATEIFPILGPIFYDDFESGLSKWTTITGLWHMTNASSAWSNPYHSPTHSMWFGNESTGDYDTGYQETGELTSIPIDLTGTDYAELEFYQWSEGEGGGWDVSYVYISTDGVNWDQIYTSSQAYISPWEKVNIDITAYTGNPSVQIRFYFDTFDDLFNDYRGWLVDDVAILGNVIIPHDLRVSLEVPENPEIGNSYLVNATVTNIGTSAETGVNFFIYLNQTVASSVYISSLASGAIYILNYMWTVTHYGEFNFTAYAPPVSGEFITNNNIKTAILPIHEINLFGGMFIDYTFTQIGTGSGSTRLSYSPLSGSMFHVTWEGSVAGILLQGYWDVDAETRILQNSGGLSFGNDVHTPFWIFTDTSLGNIIPISVDGEGDHNFMVTGDLFYELSGFGLLDIWILEDLAYPGAVAWYEKSTGLLLYGDFLYGGGNYLLEFLDTNAYFENVVFDHELNVYLEVPLTEKVDETYVIEATVKNWGINDEYDVDLFLYLEGLEVDSITIPTLYAGMEQTIQYEWTPILYGDYNFTAYAPSVPLESYLENNIQTKIVSLFETELFNGLYMKYNYSEGMNPASANFTYSFLGGSIYQESMGAKYMGMHMTYNWQVDAKTRIMSGGSIFGDGYHTPAWIFTNVSLSDMIPIAVDGEGDHIFNVSKEFLYDLPGFGPVAIWQLVDLTQPGGIIWYEQSTGILLNGTFYYDSGISYYEFDFIDTNAELTIIAPPDPFILSSTADVPDYNGKFNLMWTESHRADNYTIYQHSQLINSINGSLTILANEIEDLYLELKGYENGTYYFIVVSHNLYGDTLSNCIKVNVSIPEIPPDPFTLSSNAGDPDDDGDFVLLWTDAYRAENYSVYVYSSYITVINGSLMQLADEIEVLNLPLMGYVDGTYYFKVVAHNNFGDTFSNCLEITVEYPPPGDFTLSSNAGNPDGDGNFDLTWTASSDAVSYSVYRSSDYITEVNGTLTMLGDGMTELQMAITGYQNGEYYFIVVAHNAYGDTLSNCIKVTVQHPAAIPGYNLMLFIVVMVAVSSLILKKKLKKVS